MADVMINRNDSASSDEGEQMELELILTSTQAMNPIEELKRFIEGQHNTEEDLPSSETLNWADGLLLVYAITDRRSFNYVRRVKQMLCCDVPLALVGNKGDMVHLRQVSTEEDLLLLRNILEVLEIKSENFESVTRNYYHHNIEVVFSNV
uniref:small monomeric GTPase n=1 Tax=Timema monikensis TaxID=170555 RepID=A0A7R9E051_9NEOP|nr:unnamed protein product [Timema monikensis]